MSEQSTSQQRRMPQPGDRLMVDSSPVTVRMVQTEGEHGVQIAVEVDGGGLRLVSLDWEALKRALGPAEDGAGDPVRAITALWANWMRWTVPRIRSAVLATTPLQPYPHQDEAVSGHMLTQPRLRLLLGDEPGTGKTIMTGMYMADGWRRGLLTGRVLIVVPAHLVSKWLLDLRRYFGIEAQKVTAEIGRSPLPLREDVDTWVVSLDLYTYNPDVRRKLGGARASWSLAVFDEAHRLTPTSQYLSAARDVADRCYHLLLLTATPHRGKEDFFRALFNLLDSDLYAWSGGASVHPRPLRPSSLHYLRRMKESLRDHDGEPLFKPRYAEVKPVGLTGSEQQAYDEVMRYVDDWYANRSTLAHSIYGKRAASSLHAALQTLLRRSEALKTTARPEREAHVPEGYDDPDFESANLEDDAAWEEAERAIVQVASRDRRAELQALDGVVATLRAVLDHYDPPPSKWIAAEHLLRRHGIVPGAGQALIFTEFTDTAWWLYGRFAHAGFSVEVLEGTVPGEQRDALQRRFLSREFQILVSTDAGGEGIDLQSAHVMLNWDIPWSLVRLEQRMGRLHRIGQTQPVSVYHLVAPDTREGRVQAVMLENFTLAARALNGRIFDLMDAAAAGVGFNYARALADAQRSPQAAEQAVHQVPDGAALQRAAEELAAQADRGATTPDLAAAQERLAADRLEAINPVIVESFLRQVARAEDWSIRQGGARGMLVLRSPGGLPDELGGGHEREVFADERARRQAWEEGVLSARDALVLGPAEEAFGRLVERAARDCEPELWRGAHAADAGSLSDYTLMAFAARLERHDGSVERHIVPLPLLIRFSGGQAFPVAWESVMRLEPSGNDGSRPAPAAKTVCEAAGRAAAADEQQRRSQDAREWIAGAKRNLDSVEQQFRRQLRDQPLERRAAQREKFDRDKRERLARLDGMADVSVSDPLPIGWVQVRGTGTLPEMGTDPDSEQRAIGRILAELEAHGYDVDDRQTAGVGYDLYARHRTTREVRLIEVKGQKAELAPVTLERSEWEQAQQRGDHYWLYVVIRCATEPQVFARIVDPANAFGGARTIQRHQISVTQLREAVQQ